MSQLHSDARLLGGTVSGGEIHCPGPGHSRKDDRSLSLRPSSSSPVGYIFKSFAGDDPRECLDHIRACLGLPAFAAGQKEPQRKVLRTAEPEADPPDNTEAAKKIWIESGVIRGSLAEQYLFQRGHRLASDIDWHRVLRFHRRTRAMVALFRNVLTDAPVAIQRTFLTVDGTKISRRMLGPVKGAAIKIDRLGDSTTLAIGEGLESSLSGRAMGFSPAWAVGNDGAIADFPCLPGVTRLQIFAENDASGANEKALQECAARWHEAGRKVSAIRPAAGCNDLNDEWRGFDDLPDKERAADFLETCKRFWPGAVIAWPK